MRSLSQLGNRFPLKLLHIFTFCVRKLAKFFMLVFAQIYRSISKLQRKMTVAWSSFDFYLT